MKLILLHIVVCAVVYVVAVAFVVGIMGVVNLLFRKPFTDRWRHYLSSVALALGVGMLVDLLPRRLLFAVGLPAGAILLGVVLWVFIKYPGVPARRESTSDKNSV